VQEMKDKFSLDNPELIGLATVRIAYLNSDPEQKQKGSIYADCVFTPDLDSKSLKGEKIEGHVYYATLATNLIIFALNNPYSPELEYIVNIINK